MVFPGIMMLILLTFRGNMFILDLICLIFSYAIKLHYHITESLLEAHKHVYLKAFKSDIYPKAAIILALYNS